MKSAGDRVVFLFTGGETENLVYFGKTFPVGATRRGEEIPRASSPLFEFLMWMYPSPIRKKAGHRAAVPDRKR